MDSEIGMKYSTVGKQQAKKIDGCESTKQLYETLCTGTGYQYRIMEPATVQQTSLQLYSTVPPPGR